MSSSTVILNSVAMRRALMRIAHEIAERNVTSAEVALVGIHRGGVYLARRLAGMRQTANAVHPGVIRTNLIRHQPILNMAAAILGLLVRTLFHGQTINAILLGGISMIVAAGLMLRVKDERTPT